MGTSTSRTGGYRPSSENIGLDSSSITHPVAMTATPPKDSDHHRTDTAHGNGCLEFFTFKHQVRRTTWHKEFIGDLVLVTCCPFGGGNVGRSMHLYAECFMSVMLRSWVLAIQILVRRVDRKTVEQLRLAKQKLRQEEEELQPERKKPAMKRNIPIGQHQVKEAYARDRPKPDRHRAE